MNSTKPQTPDNEVAILHEKAKTWRRHYRDEASKAQKCKQAFIEQEKEVARLRELLENTCKDYYKVSDEVTRLRAALELIAAPIRPDGTYNRCREACEQLAKEALKTTEK